MNCLPETSGGTT